MEPKLYKMKFVGFKEDGSGELKRSSPGGIKRHEIRELPLGYAQSMWWELVDALPSFVLPDQVFEDSVFIEDVFVPKETFADIDVIELPVNKDPVDEVLYDQMTVKSLKLFIEGRGGKVDSKWRKAELVVEARRIHEAMKDAEASDPVIEEPADAAPEEREVIDLEPIEGEGHTAENQEVVYFKVEPDAEPDGAKETPPE